MKQLPLGGTGLKVSQLSLGCLNFGTRTAKDVSYRLLDQYIDAGGNFLDTANNYAFWNNNGVGGQSETLLGQWMKEKGNRDQVVVATKVGANPTIPETAFESLEGLSKAAIIKAVDESLMRLQTDYIDLYYAHIDDRNIPLEETLAVFDQLVRAGKVRAIGCSNYYTWRIEEARNISHQHDFTSYCCAQQRYTYLRPKTGADFNIQVHVSDEMLNYFQTRNDMTLLAYSPLIYGFYSRQDEPIPEQYDSVDSQYRLEILRQIAAELQVTTSQVVLAWMLHSTPPVIPLIAASTPEQLQENLLSAYVTLTPKHMKRLNNA